MRLKKGDYLNIVHEIQRKVKECLRIEYPDEIRSVPFMEEFTAEIELMYYDVQQAIETTSRSAFRSAFLIKVGQRISLIKYEFKIERGAYHLIIHHPYENTAVAHEENFAEHFSNELAFITNVLNHPAL